jgi:Zn-finger nucleic acid-binding protein
MATTPCPRCGTALGERLSGRATLLACRDCGGVWLAPESARKVVEHVQGALTLIVLSERVAGSSKTLVDRVKVALCPFDAEPLARVTVDGVEVDVCRVHGTWFDAGEVHRIANAYTAQLALRMPAVRRDSSPAEGADVLAFLGAVLDATTADD